MRITDVEPMVDMCASSEGYGKLFGVILHCANGTRRRFSDIGLALCAPLTRSQRKYVEGIQRQIEGQSADGTSPL